MIFYLCTKTKCVFDRVRLAKVMVRKKGVQCPKKNQTNTCHPYSDSWRTLLCALLWYPGGSTWETQQLNLASDRSPCTDTGRLCMGVTLRQGGYTYTTSLDMIHDTMAGVLICCRVGSVWCVICSSQPLVWAQAPESSCGHWVRMGSQGQVLLCCLHRKCLDRAQGGRGWRFSNL